MAEHSPSASGFRDAVRNFEAMSLSSVVTSVTSEDMPPPPPPLELERWQTLSKSGYYGDTGKRSIFSRNFLTSPGNQRDDMRGRGGGRYSRESSVASDKSSDLGSSISLASRSSTLSRIFSRNRKRFSRARSVSIDDTDDRESFCENNRTRMGLSVTLSTPATPTPRVVDSDSGQAFGTLRGRGRNRQCPGTPSISQKIRMALNNTEKKPVGKNLNFFAQPLTSYHRIKL